MVEIDPKDSYRDRLWAAMQRANCSVKDLAQHLGVTEFAIKKLFKGGSHTLSLMNHFKAASFLKADPTELALGEHAPKTYLRYITARTWPFPRIDERRVCELSDRQIRILENEMLATAETLHVDIRARTDEPPVRGTPNPTSAPAA